MSKNVDMICRFDKNGKIRPMKFRMQVEDELIVVNIDKILAVTEIKKDVNYKDIIYKCKCIYSNTYKIINITFNNKTNKWSFDNI